MSDIQLLPKWIMKRYLILWNKFRNNEFTFEEANSLLATLKKPDNKKIVALFLAELRKSGWLIVNFDPLDTRRRIYRLKPYEDIFNDVVRETKAGD